MRKITLFVVTLSLMFSFAASVAAHDQRPVSNETILARQKFFGLDSVDPKTGAMRTDRVIMSWTGSSAYAASFKGHVVLLDSWLARGGKWASFKYMGATPDELAALKPELVLIGHTHNDHTADLPKVIRANPDALIVGTAEHCRDIKLEVTDVGFNCLPIFAEGAELGTITELSGRNYLLPGVDITAIKHPHSSAPVDPVADPVFPWSPALCKTTPGLALADYPPDPVIDYKGWPSPASGRISIIYQFRIGDFALLWENTAGYIEGNCHQAVDAPGCEKVPAALASLPQTDVRFASVVVSGKSVLFQHNRAVRERLFIPSHYDACGYFAKKPLEDAVAEIPEETRPVMWFFTDPGDYLRPIVFDWNAKIWKDNGRLN
jgi:hypothetical protein